MEQRMIQFLLLLLLLPLSTTSQDLTSCLLLHGSSLRLTNINSLSTEEKRFNVIELLGGSVDYDRKSSLISKTNEELVAMCAPQLPAGAISSSLHYLKYQPQCEHSGKAE